MVRVVRIATYVLKNEYTCDCSRSEEAAMTPLSRLRGSPGRQILLGVPVVLLAQTLAPLWRALTLAALLGTVCQAQTYILSNACSSVGPTITPSDYNVVALTNGGVYSTSLNCGLTIYAGNVTSVVTLSLSAFNTRSGYDYLRVYNGQTSSSTLLASLSGAVASPGTYVGVVLLSLPSCFLLH